MEPNEPLINGIPLSEIPIEQPKNYLAYATLLIIALAITGISAIALSVGVDSAPQSEIAITSAATKIPIEPKHVSKEVKITKDKWTHIACVYSKYNSTCYRDGIKIDYEPLDVRPLTYNDMNITVSYWIKGNYTIMNIT
jgi:hypothetical protein